MHMSSKQLKPDIIIIGAGIIGLSIAYHLLKADRKLSITILEKEKMLGMGSTDELEYDCIPKPRIRLLVGCSDAFALGVRSTVVQ